MMVKNLRSWAISFLVCIVCVLAIVWLFPRVHPLGALRLSNDAATMGRKGVETLRAIGVDPGESFVPAELRADKSVLRALYDASGMERGNQLLGDSVDGYYWETRWISTGTGAWRMVARGSEEVVRGEKEPPSLHLFMSMHGSVLDFDRAVNDSLPMPSVDPARAREIALEFLRRFSPELRDLVFLREIHTDLGTRVNHEFVWSTSRGPAGIRPEVIVKIAGDQVVRMSVVPQLPPKEDRGTAIIHDVLSAVGLIVLIGMFIVIGIRRARAYEISFRQGLIFGVFVGLMFGIEMYVNMNDGSPIWQILAAVTISPIFLGGAFALTWAVSETVGREASPRKFVTLDLLTNGLLFHSLVGRSVIRGMAMGFGSLLVWLVGAWAVGSIGAGVFVAPDNEMLSMLSSANPLGRIILHNIYAGVFPLAALLIFPYSVLRRRIRIAVLLIAVTALIFGMLNREGVQPAMIGVLVSSLAAMVIVWGYARYDVLAAFVGVGTGSLWLSGMALYSSGNPGLNVSSLVLASLFGIVALLALLASLTRDRQVDLDALSPGFVKHVTERERLQRELEIARDVQMSFLPKTNPKFAGVEIAGRCAPAQEVGGDYFDFIDLGAGSFGVAVGDVSGKGTQAAFYMTLTKGFLKAVTKACHSPAAVLTQLNNLFFENVERGTFISMVYGIFDIPHGTLVLARAGHNPVIRHQAGQAKAEFVHHTGLALGLEGGATFGKAIQETQLPLAAGDMYVFYTDGFTEAMDKGNEEFGDTRLLDAVARYADGPAPEVMENVFKEVTRFAGRAKQHDDMTIVVVKITPKAE